MWLKSNKSMTKSLVLAWLFVLAVGISGIFWHSAWKYSLPTPVPKNYHDVQQRAAIILPPSAKALASHLFYRGNYNRSRYCNDEKTGFARLALDSLLQHHLSITLSLLAYKAYGCQLPSCTQ
jgi:hypothetical protein